MPREPGQRLSRAERLAGLALVALLAGWLLAVDDVRDLTRIRNALLADFGTEADADWPPSNPPAAFRGATRAPTESFVALAERAAADAAATRPAEASLPFALAAHLASGPGRGGAVQRDSLTAYYAITEQGRGYCADYSQVYLALGLAAGLEVREWGMSFDGFGGDGHTFNEAFDEGTGRWLFLDAFNSFYVVSRRDGRPMSALEFRRALERGATLQELDVVPISPAKFGFRTPERALEYYRRGIDQFYLWNGNDIFDYESHPVLALLGRYSRIAEQAVALLIGAHPRLLVIETGSNADLVEDLIWLRRLVLLSAALGGLAAGILILGVTRRIVGMLRA